MATHKLRTGKLLVCHWCRSGDCGDSVVHNIPEVVCHCSKCQPVCPETGCQPENIKNGRRPKPSICPSCHLQTPCGCHE